MTWRRITLGPTEPSILVIHGHWVSVYSNSIEWLSTVDENASVTFYFVGPSITVSGSLISNLSITSPHLLFTLDGQHVYNPHAEPGILYASSELYSGRHNLTMTLVSEHSRLSIHNVTFSMSRSTFDSQHETLVAVSAVLRSCLLVISLLAFVLLFLHRRRRFQTSPGPFQVNLPDSKKSFTSKNYSLHGLTFTTFNSSDNSVGLLPPPPSKRKLCPADLDIFKQSTCSLISSH